MLTRFVLPIATREGRRYIAFVRRAPSLWVLRLLSVVRANVYVHLDRAESQKFQERLKGRQFSWRALCYIGSPISDPAVLDSFPRVRAAVLMSVRLNRAVSSLSGVATLEVDGTGASQLRAALASPALRWLFAPGLSVDDLANVRGPVSYLNIPGTAAVPRLAQAHAVRTLALSDVAMLDLSNLATMSHLEELHISNVDRLVGFASVRSLARLRKLVMFGIGSIDDSHAIEGLGLQYFSFSGRGFSKEQLHTFDTRGVEGYRAVASDMI